MTPPINAAKIERLARLATPGPWHHNIQIGAADNGIYEANGSSLAVVKWRGGSGQQFRHADAYFIASANPQTLLTLIAALREAKDALEKIETNPHWPEIIKPCATKTLRSIAEKVEGL